MLKTHTLIIGGGLAGLAAGRALQGKKEYIIAERENRPGGLAATVKKGAFQFDYSGHLLHLRWPETSKLILGALGGNCTRLKRDARIYAHKSWTPYPFQANLSGMPAKVKSECVSGFLAAYNKNLDAPAPGLRPEVFSRWTRRVFGNGISEHFMLPYNAKLWQYPLERLTTEWCAPFVPTPKPEEVVEGAYGKRSEGLGYNTVFNYPKRGGIGALPTALAMDLDGLRLGLEVESFNLKKGVAEVRHFGPVHFKRLINTSPLNEFIARAEDAPAAVKRAAARLRHNTVYVLNLGVKGVHSDMHWGYFPDERFPFYRAGIATNFSKALAPRGCASFYIEIATDGRGLDLASAETAVIGGLKAAGLIKSREQVVEKLWLKIPCAYVIYNRERAEALPVISAWLKAGKIQSIGRYGAWKYSFMEESVKEGLEAAGKILKGY
ncbi:MAG TPA: NAD(P)-binding protein [Elusimicrobiales bacterium]|nr:NAD(P)-binding protein [Elusimicrobiales bacterium]